MKAEYRNAKRSKVLIRGAMVKLLETKNLSEVSVADIVRLANINRGTFYNHYCNPVEILEEIRDEIMDKLTDGLKKSALNKDIDSLMDIVIDHFSKNENEYKIIVKAIPMSIIDRMKQEFINQIYLLKVNIDELTIYFIINGLVGIYLDYLNGAIQMNYSELKERTKRLIIYAMNKNNEKVDLQ